MALETFGTDTARQIDLATRLCHDLVLDESRLKPYMPDQIGFNAGVDGVWKVTPSYLDGKPAVEIRIAVG